MNPSEGLRRVATALRWIGKLGAGLFVVAALFIVSDAPSSFSIWHWIAVAIIAGGWWAICAGVAWIIQGFGETRA